MNLVSAVLCEAANTLADGRFNVLGGGINDVVATKFPVVIKLSMVLRFEFMLTEEGRHAVDVRLINSDGKPVLKPLVMNFTIPTGRKFANFVIDIGQLKIPEEDGYSFEILVDEHYVQSLPLEAKHRKKD